MAQQVLKITFEGTLRRVLVPLQQGKPNGGLAFLHLDAKVRELFSLPSFAPLVITYVDAEGDTVTLANDDDYGDACLAQALNPLKLSVKTMGSSELVRYDSSLSTSDNAPSRFFISWWKRLISFRWLQRQSLPILHHGVRCDCCGMTPIDGPRYTSTKLSDYDLCAVCFKNSGDYDGYLKVDSPILAQHLAITKGFERGNNVAEGEEAGMGLSFDCKLLSTLICHYTVSPGDDVPCVWQMLNNGSLPWPKGTGLVSLGGNTLGHAIGLQLPENGLPCGEKIDVCTRISAPKEAGQHVGAWSLITPSGITFGERLHLVLEVVDHLRQGSALDEWPEKLVHEHVGWNPPVQDLTQAMDRDCGKPPKCFQVEGDSTFASKKIDSNLQSAADSLVSVSGWDPILRELQDMGFLDSQSNQQLLLKNQGSIKNTVRELVEMEKSLQMQATNPHF